MPLSRYGESLDSTDLNLLQRVFDRICMERGLLPNSSDADAIAANLVRLWQSGHHDEEALHTIAGREE